MSALGWIIYSYKPSPGWSRQGVELEDDAYGEFRLYRSEDLAAVALVGLAQRTAENPDRIYSLARVTA